MTNVDEALKAKVNETAVALAEHVWEEEKDRGFSDLTESAYDSLLQSEEDKLSDHLGGLGYHAKPVNEAMARFDDIF
jgi:hypothetical protein